MARCSYHPDVETDLTCTECGRPICPREMVLTPVGYKCPEHARMKPAQYRFVKPVQLLRASVVGAALGIGGAILLAMSGFSGSWLAGILWGALTAAAVRKASGGHLGKEVGVVAAISLAAGGLVGALLGMSLITPIIAVVVALIQLAAIGSR